MPLVEVVSISKSYARRAGLRATEQMVVENVSFTIDAGQTLGLAGESGSGKTTVARIILGLARPSAGSVRVAGIDVARSSGAQMRRLRRQMQPVFQDPYGALNPRMNVLDLVGEPLVIHGITGDASPDPVPAGGTKTPPGWLTPRAWGVKKRAKLRASLRTKVVELLAEVGLDESALGRYPHEFSGGQRQRINIARALALRPRLLVLDEPVSALDVSVSAQIVNLLRRLQREHGLTYLFISHSMPLVRYLSTHIAVMERGRLIETGEAEALCAHPRQPYTKQLLAATPELPFAGQP
jgi:ABC-type glutathione transport system ATPase component